MQSTRPTPHVLLGNLGPIVLEGMRRLLGEEDVEIVGQQVPPQNLPAEVQRVQPDIVVLALDEIGSQQLAEHVRHACALTKIVLWASSEDLMEVIDPGSTEPRWVLSRAPDDLICEMRTLQVTRAEE